MSDTVDRADSAVSSAPRQPWRRRRLIVLGVAALVALVGGLATVITLRHLDHQYGPIESGPFGGPLSAAAVAGGDNSERFRVGPGGTVQYLESIANRGPHSVKITSIETDQIVTTIRWSAYRVVPDGSVFGTSTPWRSFPAIVPGHYGVIRLLVTIRRPTDCDAVPHGPDGVFYSFSHVVHWDSLLDSHTTATGDIFDRSIRVC